MLQQKQDILRKPKWLKIKLPIGSSYTRVKDIVNQHHLHTICSSGQCPNMGECWGLGTATFMILGDICTRNCRFCAVKTGIPNAVDENEPQNVANSVKLMNLKHCVITSVDRDDLSDGGAAQWAKTVQTIKLKTPNVTIETLIPDFNGNAPLIQQVIDARPDVISHNLETVRRLTHRIRSKAQYDRSLQVIKQIADSDVISKSGIMVGIGETDEEVFETMRDLRNVGCQVMTIGQYLQPSLNHIAVDRYVPPEIFDKFREEGIRLGFIHIESSPLVRSSYHAEKHVK